MNSVFERAGSSWSKGIGAEADIVIASRVRLARNLSGLPFPYRMNQNEAQELLGKAAVAVKALAQETKCEYQLYRLEDVAHLDRMILVEKHLISPELAKGLPGRAVAVSEDESVSIMINEEDHLRIQCLLPAFQLTEAWQLASKIDDLLEERLPLAFDADFGYLTACPTNTGCGLRASVMLHLPALALSKQLNGVFSALPRMGMTVRGIYGEGSEAHGNLYQISNQVTLGLAEQEIIERLQLAVKQVIDKERRARAWLQRERSDFFFDQIGRSYGILKNCRVLSAQEMMERLSLLRLGMDMGVLTPLSGKELNELMVMGQPGFLQKRAGGELSPQMSCSRRAGVMRENLKNVREVHNDDAKVD